MLLYMKCPTCKTLLGDKELTFNEELNKINENKSLSHDDKNTAVMKLYQKIGIENYCCKMRLKTYINGVNLIK